MNDAAGVGQRSRIRVDVGHHVVPQLALVLGGPVEIDVVDGRFQLGDLGLGDRQAQFALGFGQGDPQLPPGGVDSPGRPEPAHRLRGIPGDERIVVNVVTRGALTRHRGIFLLNCASEIGNRRNTLTDDPTGHPIVAKPRATAGDGLKRTVLSAPGVHGTKEGEPDDNSAGISGRHGDQAVARQRRPRPGERKPQVGATGATSNPIIISDLIKTGRFDDRMTEFLEKGLSDEEIAWQMTDYFVRQAQAVFADVNASTKGNDGYVSFELDPLLEDASSQAVGGREGGPLCRAGQEMVGRAHQPHDQGAGDSRRAGGPRSNWPPRGSRST